MLRQVMLEKVLGVSAMRSCPYLVTKSSQVAVDADGISYLLCPPTTCGCWPDALSLWFRKVLPFLATKPSFGGVAALTDSHATTVRLGPRALGPMLPGLITPCGVVLSSHCPYQLARKLLRWLALAWWRRFECPGGIVSSMRVKGEDPLTTHVKGFGVQCLGIFWAKDV
jgi:hypothetical protein